MLVQCLILLFIFLLWVHQRWTNRDLYEMGRRLKTSVKTYPVLGHSYLFFGNNQIRMQALQILGRDALKNENGLSSFWHHLYGYTLYINVADPVAAEIIMKATLHKDHTMDVIRMIIGNGSIFAPVPIWRPLRKILVPIFAPKNIKHFSTIFSKHSTLLVQQLEKSAGTGTISIWKYLTAYTMDSIVESTLGCEIHAQNNSGHPLLEAFEISLRTAATRVCSPWFYSDYVYFRLPIYKQISVFKNYMCSFIKEFITTKRKEISMQTVNGHEKECPTFMELLIRSSGGENGYTDTEIVEELMVILMAGNDTSAVASSFVCLMLSRHSDIQEKVLEELQNVFGNSDRSPTSEDLFSLKYLDVVIKETLRLYTPVPVITRKIDKGFSLPSGLKMAGGTGVVINIWAIHRNPRYWGDDAEQFRPERFTNTPLKHSAAFIPFSLGPRNCVGHQFAMMSIKTAVSTILRNFRILPPNDLPSSMQPPLRLGFDLMMKDLDNFQIRLERRINNV